MKIGFDNEKYLKIQSEHIKERIDQFAISCIWNLAESCLMTITPQEFFRDLRQIVSFRC